MGGGKGSAMKGDMEAPGLVVSAGLIPADAVETNEKGEWSRTVSNQNRGALRPL